METVEASLDPLLVHQGKLQEIINNVAFSLIKRTLSRGKRGPT